jgi:hypothetical protein
MEVDDGGDAVIVCPVSGDSAFVLEVCDRMEYGRVLTDASNLDSVLECPAIDRLWEVICDLSSQDRTT